MVLDDYIRKLARSNYWQSLYNNSKECSGIRLFKNEYNFTGIQTQFLYWLQTYNMLYSELSQLEDKYLTESVINNNIRCDAYLYYRYKKIKAEWKKLRREQRLDKLRQRHHSKRDKDADLIDVDLRSV